jgi:heme-degrading monooxygenase HmoA
VTAIYTTGRWKPNPGKDEAFVDAWVSFAKWASEAAGAGTLRLTRDVRDSEVFVSLGAWQSREAVRAWMAAPDFAERMARVLQHVDEFQPSELEVVATAEPGSASPEMSRTPGIEPCASGER